MLDTRVRLLYDACCQSGRDNHGANCPDCTLLEMCCRQVLRAGREWRTNQSAPSVSPSPVQSC